MPQVLSLQQSLLVRLSLWSILSLFAGGIMALLAPARSFWAAFGGMSAAWGLVNLLIASLGFYGIIKKMRTDSLDEHRERGRLRYLLKVNTFLDAGYIAAGVGLVWWGHSQLLQGFGWAIIVQGAFLFALDAWYYYRGGKE